MSSQSTPRVLVTAVLMLSLGGLVSPAAGVGPGKPGKPGKQASGPVPRPSPRPPADPATIECRRDAECALVVDGCCDCHQGGKRTVIPARKRGAHEAARAKRCQDVICTTMMSVDVSCRPEAHAACVRGRCVLPGVVDGGADGAPASAPATGKPAPATKDRRRGKSRKGRSPQ